METGLLNFHDEETFATSIYDQDDFSGVDGQSSLLDMMHSDLQYSSDSEYLNQTAVHWDSDEEQEHNGDLAVLPVAPSECSSLNSSREEYHKSFFEWQDSLIPYQSLDPDGVDLRLDGQGIPSELPDNIFEDSFESNTCVTISWHKPCPPDPSTPVRSSTPKPGQCPKESVSSDGSLNLDMSLSALDVNVSDLDVSELGINVSSLDIKTDNCENKKTKPSQLLEDTGQFDAISTGVSKSEIMETGKLSEPAKHKTELNIIQDDEFTSLFGVPEGSSSCLNITQSSSLALSLPVLFSVPSPVSKLENADVDQLHDMAMEFIKEEQGAQAWENLPLPDHNVDLDSISPEVSVLEAGNLESLLEQFEATVRPMPEFSQSMPASPAHFSIPPSPLSMPASPSCTAMASPLSTHTPVPSSLKPSPVKVKCKAVTPKKTTPSKEASVHENILKSLPAEIMDKIKATGRKKPISVIPAMPSKRTSRSGTHMHAAGATLSRNKLLKLVSVNGGGGENVQFDHDYCSNHDSSSNVEFVPEKLVEDIKASTKLREYEEDKSSRKDSGLESGDVSEDSEGAAIQSEVSSGYDSSSGKSKSRSSILKPRTSNQTGRPKEMLMVSVLKKVRGDTSKPPSQPQMVVRQSSTQSLGQPNRKSGSGAVKSTVLPNVKPTGFASKSCEPSSKSHVVISKSDKLSGKPVKTQSKPVLFPVKSETSERQDKPAEAKAILNHTKAFVNSVETSNCMVSATTNIVKPVGTVIKPQHPESIEQMSKPPDAPVVKTETIAHPPEQPKKRKLNLEEYRNRQKALEQKRDVKVTPEPKHESSTPLKPISVISIKAEPCEDTILSKGESNKELVLVKEGFKNVPSSVKEEKIFKSSTEVSVIHPPRDVAKNDDDLKTLSGNNQSCVAPILMKKVVKVEPEESEAILTLKAIKKEKCTVLDAEDEMEDVLEKPSEEKRKRQYRSRRMSTSSSEGSPQSKEGCGISIKREHIQKINLFPAKAKSRSVTPTKSRARSASSNSGRSSRSSSSDSSRSRSGGVRSSRKSRARRRRRRNSGRRSSSRSSGSRSSRTSRSSSNWSRRSNSVSSGSSRCDRRSSRRSRSRSTRRSRRDRSVSRASWRRWRRDSSRNRTRRERSRCRNSRGELWSSCARSWSRSRSRSHSCRRHVSRSRSGSRAGRRFSARLESGSGSGSRSRSRSRSWSSQYGSDSSSCVRRRSRSRSRSPSRKKARMERQSRSKRKLRRSRSPMRRNVDWCRVEQEQKRQIEERRVIYVGRLPEEATKAELRKRFEMFGPIVDISLHFREHADNYGFVTFAYQDDAYDAVERGNDDPSLPRYELCFGGRRKFCRERYADLDGMACRNGIGNLPSRMNRAGEGDSFDDILREVQAKLKARKRI